MLKSFGPPPIAPALVALAQQKGVAHGADALALFHQRIVLATFHSSLLLSLARYSDQLQRLLIAIEVIAQITG